METAIFIVLFSALFLILNLIARRIDKIEQRQKSHSRRLDWIIAHIPASDKDLKTLTEELKESNDQLNQAVKDNTPKD